MGFGYGLISVMFLGFVSGFALGKFMFEFEMQGCMVCALVVGIFTIMVEMVLVLLRINKMDKLKQREIKKFKHE